MDFPVLGAKDSESSYISLREAVPPTSRGHSDSVDVSDVKYTPRLAAEWGGEEALHEVPYEDAVTHPPDDIDDDTTSDEEGGQTPPIARQHQQHARTGDIDADHSHRHLGDHHQQQSQNEKNHHQQKQHQQQQEKDVGTLKSSNNIIMNGSGSSGGGGIIVMRDDSRGEGGGGARADDGGGVESGVNSAVSRSSAGSVVVGGDGGGGAGTGGDVGPKGLLKERDIAPPSEGVASSGKPGDVGEKTLSLSPPRQAPGLQTIGLGSPDSARVSTLMTGGPLDSRSNTAVGVRSASTSSLKHAWRHSGERGLRDSSGTFVFNQSERHHHSHHSHHHHQDGEGVQVGLGTGGFTMTGMRERSSTAASTSSDDSMGGGAIKQWEEAMCVAVTAPETPLRMRRGSTSVDGSVGRGAGVFSPGPRALASSYGNQTDGTGMVATRSGRPSSVGGGGGGGGGGSGSVGSGGVVGPSHHHGGGSSIGGGAPGVLGTHLRTYGWVADGAVWECMNACGAEFTTWERRHHCRCCGGIFCHNCSKNRCLVPDPVPPPGKDPLDPTRPHRVCNACHIDVQPSQEELLLKVSKARRHNDFNTNSPARHCNPPFGLDLAHEVRKSANTVNNVLATRREGWECDGLNLMNTREQGVSHSLCRNARGLVFVTVAKAGFLYAAEAGTGLCVVKLPSGDWSAPAAVGTFGLSWGFQVGCEVVDMVIPLRSNAAVEMLRSGGQVYLELDAAVAVGPVGRSVGSAIGGRLWPGEEGALGVGARYSLCKGLFAGVGVGAGFLRIIDRVNERFYGAQVSPRAILNESMPRPPAANPLYNSLAILERVTEKL